MSKNSNNLTSGNLLARNTAYSLVGQAFPVLAAIFSIPILINALGADGFGVLTLAWMVTGYFSLLDLGVGRALTKFLSAKLGQDDLEGIPGLIWAALMVSVLMGMCGTLVLVLATTTLVNDVFKIPLAIQDDVEKSFYILGIGVPIVICSAVLRGILEAYQRFDLINVLRIPVGSLTFLAPVLVLPFSENLPDLVTALVVVRLLEWLINVFFCIRVVPEMLKHIYFQYSTIVTLLRFGGWITLSNIVGPIMVYLDRFLIGSIISISAVAYYGTSYEIISRLMVIPGALVGVLFPALGAVIGQNPSRAASMMIGGMKYTFILVTPILVIIFIFAHEGLTIWVGDEFANQGAVALQWLIMGAFMTSFSYFPFAVLHAAGRPDLPAKLHLVEVGFYMMLAWILIGRYGIEGAAIAWVVRSILDTIILFYMAGRVLEIIYPKDQLLSLISLVVILFMLAFLPEDLYLKLGCSALACVSIYAYSWMKLLTSDERGVVLSYAKKLKVIKNSRPD